MPYVIASQTIPIVALAPMIVFAFGPNVTSVVVIATYLTFFPVTIAMIRGLRSPDPRALELMRSYAAWRWAIYRKVRLPASLPYLFTALKIAATASIVGRDHRRGAGRHPRRARPGDHQLQPAVHQRPGEAVGDDPRVVAARHLVLRPDPRGRAGRPARPARRGGGMTAADGPGPTTGPAPTPARRSSGSPRVDKTFVTRPRRGSPRRSRGSTSRSGAASSSR